MRPERISNDIYEALFQRWSIGAMVKKFGGDYYQTLDRASQMVASRLSDNYEGAQEWCYWFRQIKDQYPNSAVVYFIENEEGTKVKIGRTKTLWRRFEEINGTSGGGCRILLALPTRDVDTSKNLEAYCHQTFYGSRIGGEWFSTENNSVANFVVHLHEARPWEKEA